MAYSIGTIRKNDIDVFGAILPELYIADAEARYIGLLEDGEPAGVLCFSMSFDVVDVLFIGATYEEKRHEYGKLMLRYLEKLLDEAGAGARIEVIWTEEENAFYQGLLAELNEFSILDGGEVYILTPESRAASEAYQKMKAQKSSVIKYRELEEKDRADIRMQLEEEEMLDYLENTDGRYMKELSFVSMDNGTLNAAIFFSRIVDGIELSFIYARNNHSKDLAAILAEAMRVVDEKYSDEVIEFNAVNPKAVSLVKDLFKDALTAQKNYIGISFGRI